MREVVKVMLRLQELEIIREEHKIIHYGEHPEQMNNLENRINALEASLPEKWRTRYKVLRRNGLAVFLEFGGVCQNCRMVISIGVLNRMRKNEMDWICRNCGRFLLLSEVKSQG